MIQGNFTVKATEPLNHFADLCVTRGWPESAAGVAGLVERLRVAQPFLLPDSGRLFEVQGSEWKWWPSKLRLPYPCIALEYRDRFGHANLLIANEGEADTDGNHIFDVTLIAGYPMWAPVFSAHLMPPETQPSADQGFLMAPYMLAPEAQQFLRTDPKHFEVATSAGIYAIGVLAQMLCALECRNVRIETLDPPEKLQRKRQRAGRLPLVSYKVLDLDTSQRLTSARSSGCTHASPRVHLRRGHIRRLDNGPIWVNATVVRGRTPGLVVKDYRLRGPAA
jgi:hypothetical protein